MKKLILALFILCSLNACSQTNSKDSFEGVITYEIFFVPKSKDQEFNLYQKQKYGTEAKLYISKNGDFKREYTKSGDKGFDFNIYDKSENRLYAKWRNIDTVYSLSAENNSLEFIEDKELKGETIKGFKCNAYLITGRDPLGEQTVSLKYFYPVDKEYIDPNLYSNYNDFFYNKVISKIQSPYYKIIMDMNDF